MRKPLFLFVLALVALAPPPAMADLFAFDLDAQVGYSQINNVAPLDESTTLAGGVFGVRGKLEILFLAAMVDYQHFFNNADFIHVGLGADFKLPLGFIEPFFRASAGLMALAAKKGAFDPDAEDDLSPPALGFQLRGGAGLDIPLGDWFALGVAGDVGYHYITDEHGWDFSVMGYFGLRI